jgi:hypothetical protein
MLCVISLQKYQNIVSLLFGHSLWQTKKKIHFGPQNYYVIEQYSISIWCPLSLNKFHFILLRASVCGENKVRFVCRYILWAVHHLCQIFVLFPDPTTVAAKYGSGNTIMMQSTMLSFLIFKWLAVNENGREWLWLKSK